MSPTTIRVQRTEGGYVHWIISYIQEDVNMYAVLRWNMHTGKTERVLETDTRIRSMAYSFEEDALVLRKWNNLEFYDNETLELKRSMEFEKLQNWWKDMCIVNNRIITIEPDTGALIIFDMETGEKLNTLDCGKDKIQRLYGAGENQVWLWSSYWGNRIYLLNINNGQIIKETRYVGNHSIFFFAKELAENRLGVFDINNNVFKVLQQEGRMWIDITESYEVLGDDLAFRYLAIKERISGEFIINNSGETMEPREAIFVIPLNTYGQRLENESFPQGGTIVYDSLGNRYLSIIIPEITMDSTYSKTFYRADLIRWLVYFNLEKIGNTNTIDIPESLNIYLENDKNIFFLDDERVIDLYTTSFEPLPALNLRVDAIYDFARDEIDDEWDGRSDNVPGIISNMHGGCTEHSYVQVAMLRLSNLPARFNWNAYPDKDLPEINFNHKHAEVWFPEVGWLPMEPLGAEIMAGLGAHYHFIFTVNATLGNEFFDTYDRIAAYTGPNNWDLWNYAPIIVNWKRFLD